METLIVNVENKTVADFLKKMLQQFKGVRDVDFLREKAQGGKNASQLIEEEMVAYNKAKAEGGPFMTFDEATVELQKAGKL